MMVYQYQAFQLVIHSDLFFPELHPLPPSPLLQADAAIRYGNVSPDGLEAPLKKAVCFQAKKGALWLNVPDVARFLVENGNQITIDPILGVDEDSIRLFILGSCFGALLMQRGLFLLHGNAIEIGQHAISFTGVSGAGKSTLSGAFFKRGYPILADDVCAINSQGEVVASFPQIKLWMDAAKMLAIDTTLLRKIRPNIEKFAVPLGESFSRRVSSLKLVYILNSHNQDNITVKNLVGSEKILPLRAQIYRAAYMKGLAKDLDFKIQCTKLASLISLARITRPNAGNHIEKLADYIESDLENRGIDRE